MNSFCHNIQIGFDWRVNIKDALHNKNGSSYPLIWAFFKKIHVLLSKNDLSQVYYHVEYENLFLSLVHDDNYGIL